MFSKKSVVGFDPCFAAKVYRNPLQTGFGSRSFSWFSTAVSHRSYIEITWKPNPDIVYFHDFRPLCRSKARKKSAPNWIRKSFIFIIFDTCFAPKLYRNSLKAVTVWRSIWRSLWRWVAPKLYRNPLKTESGHRSFSWFSTLVSQQSDIEIRSKLDSEVVHFHYFRHLFRTKAI